MLAEVDTAVCVCEPSSRQAETGKSLGHTGQAAYLNP